MMLAEKKRRESVEARSDAILRTFALVFACVLGAMGVWLAFGGQLP